jgi:hypothetical protein
MLYGFNESDWVTDWENEWTNVDLHLFVLIIYSVWFAIKICDMNEHKGETTDWKVSLDVGPQKSSALSEYWSSK